MASSSRHGHGGHSRDQPSRSPSLSPSPPPPRHRDDLGPPPRRRDDRGPSPARHRGDDPSVPSSGGSRYRDDPAPTSSAPRTRDADREPDLRRDKERELDPDSPPPPRQRQRDRERDQDRDQDRDREGPPEPDVEEPVVNETVAMISNMRPYLHRDTYVYTELPYESGATLPALLPHLHSLTTERESMSILLPRSVAKEHGLPTNLSPRLSHIELTVRSSLEGVGLTAAVTAALSAGEIACNIVAGLRHDHLFVPEDRADVAMDVLKALSKQTRKIEREQRRSNRRESKSDPTGPPPSSTKPARSSRPADPEDERT